VIASLTFATERISCEIPLRIRGAIRLYRL
jgi:hypothetical protein